MKTNMMKLKDVQEVILRLREEVRINGVKKTAKHYDIPLRTLHRWLKNEVKFLQARNARKVLKLQNERIKNTNN